MSIEVFEVRGTGMLRAVGNRRWAINGVNASGDLEVLIERVLADDECMVQVHTAIAGFRGVWEVVIRDFFDRGRPGGLRFSINDGGARPDMVTLRLLQGVQLLEATQ
jgi:malonate decarboxylase delta subunit